MQRQITRMTTTAVRLWVTNSIKRNGERLSYVLHCGAFWRINVALDPEQAHVSEETPRTGKRSWQFNIKGLSSLESDDPGNEESYLSGDQTCYVPRNGESSLRAVHFCEKSWGTLIEIWRLNTSRCTKQGSDEMVIIKHAFFVHAVQKIPLRPSLPTTERWFSRI